KSDSRCGADADVDDVTSHLNQDGGNDLSNTRASDPAVATDNNHTPITEFGEGSRVFDDDFRRQAFTDDASDSGDADHQ
ncbi:MAG TPA: hypothetical protein VJ044_05505, partial [Candidatus Hodarchaeales archaeon]|nr:hypothetical protein [Candidatus Hodarchaeales archaeon]